ncbi:MAG: hypothetical protein WDM79_04490 [Terricaulis sp.]
MRFARIFQSALRQDYIQLGVGHYGVFNGRRFRTEIAPRMREFHRTFQAPASRGAGAAKAKKRVPA